MPDSFREMIDKINEARSSISPPPKPTHRLSVSGRDAAALSGTLRADQANVSSRRPSQQPWAPSSWTTRPIKQVAVYPDKGALEKSLSKLERLPPIVSPHEIIKLKRSLREVALGNAFLLQGGDCAELFSYCEENSIDSKLKLLLQMSLVLIYGANKPVIRVARMAGQYAKPRSSPTEVIDGQTIPSYRGDILNGFELDQRQLDPDRLVQAYFHSATTLNYVRAQLAAGAADLHNPLDWNLGHVKDKELQAKYQQTVSSITESLRFMRTVGADKARQLETVDLYTSHEGLLLEYEQSLTRRLKHPAGYETPKVPSVGSLAIQDDDDDDGKGWYNTGTHFLWVGDRTRQLDGAHIEYFRGLENPIGIKVGPSMAADELVSLLDVINPAREIGKVTLVTRYGENKIEEKLGPHIDAVKKSGHIVVWQCDPMHGNTHSTASGIKTRHFAAIMAEVSAALRIHAAHGTFLGGVHLELTGDAVTECVGGSEGLIEEDLSLNYTTYCDPRLNEKQALELAFLVAGSMKSRQEQVPNGTHS